MSEHWDFFPCNIGDDTASIFVDIGIAKELPLSGYDKLLNIRLHLKKPGADGLSTSEEFEELCELEDTVEEIFKEFDVYYVGRITSAGFREYYYYASSFAFKNVLAQTLQSFDYTFDVAESEDPSWSSYKEFLYPTSLDWQIIKDRQVIDNLQKNGDQCSDPRAVDHYACFSTNADALNFCNKAFKEGFEAGREISKGDDNSLSVHLIRKDIPGYPFFSNVTIKLLNMAEECNGYYDGWGCSVVTP